MASKQTSFQSEPQVDNIPRKMRRTGLPEASEASRFLLTFVIFSQGPVHFRFRKEGKSVIAMAQYDLNTRGLH